MILTTHENATQGEMQRYENNYKALNLIISMIVSHTLKLLIMFDLNFTIFMRALLKLSLLIRTLTISSIKPSLRNQESA
jgi:hypothetical protein